MNNPERTCIVCRKVFDKKFLVRIVGNKEGNVELDITATKNGRGAYICKNRECIERLKKVRGLERSFKKRISDDIYDKIIAGLTLIQEG